LLVEAVAAGLVVLLPVVFACKCLLARHDPAFFEC